MPSQPPALLEMATRTRFFRPFLFTSLAAATGGTILYISYRPRNLPGSDPALVPPPQYGEDGRIEPPRFPRVKSRGEQIAQLRRSAGKGPKDGGLVEKGRELLAGGSRQEEDEQEEEEPYDLLVIGGGATGSGIALDAVTRGLKVALVERDDFASGTSSKSTKLVHGGVRYLEKAIFDLDYSQ